MTTSTSTRPTGRRLPDPAGASIVEQVDRGRVALAGACPLNGETLRYVDHEQGQEVAMTWLPITKDSPTEGDDALALHPKAYARRHRAFLVSLRLSTRRDLEPTR
jgi:hypothetical protein